MPRPKTKQYKHLVIDAGNGNTKVAVAGESEIIPSLLSQNTGDYIRGGFSLSDEPWILGWDNINRSDAIVIADKDTGKLDYLHLLMAGAISSMRSVIEPDDKLAVHVLTLNPSRKDFIAEALTKLAQDFTIDGELMNLELKLAGVYPEGYGASLYAGAAFQNHKRVAVLDCGMGTLNLSQYHQSLISLPRRESFTFIPYGVHSLIDILSDLLTGETSNGRVDNGLIRQALDSNSYRYLSTYEGVDIWNHACKAVDIWTEQPKVKQLLVQTLRQISAGVPVVLVGGGFAMHVMQQKVQQLLTSQGHKDLVHIAETPLTVGVDGLAIKLNN
jgi:hypothetical protein